MPAVLAEQYHLIAPFYISLLKERDKIIHGGGTVETIYTTERGFCVNPKAKMFQGFPWKAEHHFNEGAVTLMPWIAHVVIGTMEACNLVVTAFASAIVLLPEIAPAYRVFMRDRANAAFGELWSAAKDGDLWWSGGQATRSGRGDGGQSGEENRPD